MNHGGSTLEQGVLFCCKFIQVYLHTKIILKIKYRITSVEYVLRSSWFVCKQVSKFIYMQMDFDKLFLN